METLANRLQSWIKEQVTSAKRNGVVVGLSGGLDSSVVVILCKQAFPHNTLGVIMPCHSSQADLDLAQALAQKFDIPTLTVILDQVSDQLLEALPGQVQNQASQRLAEANVKPRLRMITLYYLANQLGYLVVGTSNKSELAVGYFTKYGDGGADILPLGNLVKGQVKELAAHLGVPDEIIKRPPSAGFWPGQTDEAELGITYQELDHYLITGEANQEVKGRIDNLALGSAHKRKPPPIPPP